MINFDKNSDAVYMVFEENPMGLKNASLHFKEKTVKIENEAGAFVIPYGTDATEETVFPGTNLRTLSKGEWTAEHVFLLKLNVIEEDFSPVYLEFGFAGEDAVSVHFKNTSEPAFLRKFSGFAGGTWNIKRKVWTNRGNMVR